MTRVLEYKTFGQALKAYQERKAAQSQTGIYTQNDLANELEEGGYDFSRTSRPNKLISDWMNDYGKPNYETVMNVALALNLTIDELLTGDEYQNGKTKLSYQKDLGLNNTSLETLKLLKNSNSAENQTALSFINFLLTNPVSLYTLGSYLSDAAKAYDVIAKSSNARNIDYRENAYTDFWEGQPHDDTRPDYKIDVSRFRISELLTRATMDFIEGEGRQNAKKK